jgi:hypothetical protein
MTLVLGKKVAEVHVKLCHDETHHYPELLRKGKIDKKTFDAWTATLTLDELRGHYHRNPPEHFVAHLTEEETALMDTEVAAFNKVLSQRVKDRAENHLRFNHHAHKRTTAMHVVPKIK